MLAGSLDCVDRVVLNADIKDLGVDVLEGNANAMGEIASGTRVAEASRKASDNVLRLKDGAIKQACHDEM